jgi:Zn-dependent protease
VLGERRRVTVDGRRPGVDEPASAGVAHGIATFLSLLFSLNLLLGCFNLLPIPPLDGGRIMVSLLPNALAYRFAQLERFGFVLVIVLMATGILNMVMNPLVGAALDLITTVFGI